VFQEMMRGVPDAPMAAWQAVMDEIADYTNEDRPQRPDGPETTYVAVLWTNGVTDLYAVPDEVITQRQRATLVLADCAYVSYGLPDIEAPDDVFHGRRAAATPEHVGAAARVLSWLGSGDVFADTLALAHEFGPSDGLPTLDELTADGSPWGGFQAASFNDEELKDYELAMNKLRGRPTALIRIAAEIA
jgi:hypothetical protein